MVGILTQESRDTWLVDNLINFTTMQDKATLLYKKDKSIIFVIRCGKKIFKICTSFLRLISTKFLEKNRVFLRLPFFNLNGYNIFTKNHRILTIFSLAWHSRCSRCSRKDWNEKKCIKSFLIYFDCNNWTKFMITLIYFHQNYFLLIKLKPNICADKVVLFLYLWHFVFLLQQQHLSFPLKLRNWRRLTHGLKKYIWFCPNVFRTRKKNITTVLSLNMVY